MTSDECYENARGETEDEAIERLRLNCEGPVPVVEDDELSRMADEGCPND